MLGSIVQFHHNPRRPHHARHLATPHARNITQVSSCVTGGHQSLTPSLPLLFVGACQLYSALGWIFGSYQYLVEKGPVRRVESVGLFRFGRFESLFRDIIEISAGTWCIWASEVRVPAKSVGTRCICGFGRRSAQQNLAVIGYSTGIPLPPPTPYISS